MVHRQLGGVGVVFSPAASRMTMVECDRCYWGVAAWL